MSFVEGLHFESIEDVSMAIQADGSTYLKETFSSNEIDYCHSFKKSSSENFAGRLAVKKAFIKALNLDLESVQMSSIEVMQGNFHSPHISFSGDLKLKLEVLKLKNVWVSLAHEKKMAVGFLVIEKF